MTQWITVPVVATDEMVDAAECVEDLYRRGTPDTWRTVYREMVKNSPRPETVVVGEVEAIDFDEDGGGAVASIRLHNDVELGSLVYTVPPPFSRWFPIDTAPTDGTEIILCTKATGDMGICYWRDDASMVGWTWGLGKAFHGATHWQPLPKLPE